MHPDNPILDQLFSDAEIARWLTGEAEVAAMLRFEAALALAEAEAGVIPAEAGPAIASALEGLSVSPADLTTPTSAAGVPAPALVRRLREEVGEPFGQYIHWGATSQDVVDTGWILRLGEILPVLKERLAQTVVLLAKAAEATAETPMAGRTRSQLATPITLGLRIAGWLTPLARCLDRLAELSPRLLVLQFGGASGNLSILGDKGQTVSLGLADRLGLGLPAKPWHVERDALVELGAWLSLVSTLLGRVGADLILMGRTEIGELQAGEGGGSSTMPQKSNPVLAEALVTLARLNITRQTAMAEAALAVEERDATAWAMEWLTLPDMLIATGAGLRHAMNLSANLRPNPDAMTRNLDLGGGAVHAEALAFDLARHMPLSEAQDLVKQGARAIQESGGDLLSQVGRICARQGLPIPRPDAEQSIRAAARITHDAIKEARRRTD